MSSPFLVAMTSFRIFFVALVFGLLQQAHASPSAVSGAFRCDDHDPQSSQPTSRADGCLARLAQPQNAGDYEPCRGDGNKTCYIFIQEPPFITLDAERFNSSQAAITLQQPFPCGNFSKQIGNLGGISFELHRRTSSSDDLCMWGGHPEYCNFNSLVDYTQIMADEGYRFAVTGLLLETPERQCHHHASAAFVDNSMIIIGRNFEKESVGWGALRQLTRPFSSASWGIVGGTMMLFVCVSVFMAVQLRMFRGVSFVTAFFIFAGKRDEAMANDLQVRDDSQKSPEEAVKFATKYGLSMTLFRIALLAFAGIFALFYEVAVVNFLFQQQSVLLTKSVESLSIEELQSYAVLKNSALENVWNATVNGNGAKYDGTDDSDIPWQRCLTATECVEWAANEAKNVDFVVTFETVGKHLINEVSSCERLSIFETKDILYQFNAGWLYNDRVNPQHRQQVDRDLVALRIAGTTRLLIEDKVGEFSCSSVDKPDIGPMIILVPCFVFVIPPLFGSVLVLFCWKKGKRRRKREAQVTSARLEVSGMVRSAWNDKEEVSSHEEEKGEEKGEETGSISCSSCGGDRYRKEDWPKGNVLC